MTRRLAILFALQGVATGLLLPFVVPILDARGFDPPGIGLVLGASAAATLVAYPAWGYLADVRLGSAWTVRLCSVAAAACALLLAVGGSEPAATAVLVCLVYVTVAPWGPVSDALALGQLGAGAGEYGRVRRWTSLGFVFGALAGGGAYASVGLAALPFAFGAAALGVGAAAWEAPVSGASGPWHRVARRGSSRGSDGPGDAARASGGPRALVELARRSPAFVPFLLGLGVISIGSTAAVSFLPLRILDTGGGPMLIGLGFALPAIAEIPFFSASGTIIERFGLRSVFVAGVAMSAIQYLVVSLAPEPGVITLVRIADGAAFGLRYSATVLIVARILPERVRAMGQSSTWVIAGSVAPIIGDPLGGAIYGRFGGPLLFAASALAVAAGAAIAFAALRDRAFLVGRRESAPVPADRRGTDPDASP